MYLVFTEYIVFTSSPAPESRGWLPPVFEGLGHLPLFRQAVHQKMDHSVRQSVSLNMAAITPAMASHCHSPSVQQWDPLLTRLQSAMVPCTLSLSLFFIYAVFLSTCFLFSHMALVRWPAAHWAVWCAIDFSPPARSALGFWRIVAPWKQRKAFYDSQGERAFISTVANDGSADNGMLNHNLMCPCPLR